MTGRETASESNAKLVLGLIFDISHSGADV